MFTDSRAFSLGKGSGERWREPRPRKRGAGEIHFRRQLRVQRINVKWPWKLFVSGDAMEKTLPATPFPAQDEQPQPGEEERAPWVLPTITVTLEPCGGTRTMPDRKSTRLNSSH